MALEDILKLTEGSMRRRYSKHTMRVQGYLWRVLVYGGGDIHGSVIHLRYKAEVALERRLLNHATQINIRADWMKARKHILIPYANELRIEEELHAIR